MDKNSLHVEEQFFAVVWFVLALACGALLTCQLAEVDRWMYDNNARVIDYSIYRENRRAASLLSSECIDPRSRGDLSSSRSEVTNDLR